MSSHSKEELLRMLQDKILSGEELLNELSDPDLEGRVHGLPKLERKIKQELKFLKKFETEKSSKLKIEHLKCSNLQHLSAIVKTLLASVWSMKRDLEHQGCHRQEEVSSVMHTFPLRMRNGETKKINVDIVSADGLVWTKVIARNAKALDLNSKGGNQYGQKSLMEQVKEFLVCSRQNPKLFRAPEVVFVFDNGISVKLANKIEAKGIKVKGEMLEDHDDEEEEEEEDSDAASCSSSSQESDEDLSGFLLEDASLNDFEDLSTANMDINSSTLNLDITAMMAYVSALTNGHADHKFSQKVLNDHARWEKERPVKPFLDRVFEGKNLICCESALKDFRTILDTLGGHGEKQRAEELLRRVTVVDDQVSDRMKNVVLSGNVKERSRTIFGTGDKLRVVTVSANAGFVRSVRGQGIDLAVILHESRALTEDKMIKGQQSNCDDQQLEM